MISICRNFNRQDILRCRRCQLGSVLCTVSCFYFQCISDLLRGRDPGDLAVRVVRAGGVDRVGAGQLRAGRPPARRRPAAARLRYLRLHGPAPTGSCGSLLSWCVRSRFEVCRTNLTKPVQHKVFQETVLFFPQRQATWVSMGVVHHLGVPAACLPPLMKGGKQAAGTSILYNDIKKMYVQIVIFISVLCRRC